MKRTLSLFILLVMLVFSTAAAAKSSDLKTSDRTAPVYFEGYVCGDFQGSHTGDWIGFTSDAPGDVIVYDHHATTYAAAYLNGKVYGYLYGYDSAGDLHDDFYIRDQMTSNVEYPEGASSEGEFVYGMAYNYADHTMYALCDEDRPYIASVDLETGKLTRIVDIDLGTTLGLMTFAIDGGGNFYALTFAAISSKLVRIDLSSGALTQVFDTGMPCFYAQSMTWDRQTNCLYWAHVNERTSSTNGLYMLDISAGSITYCGMIGNGMEITALYAVPDELFFTPGDVNGDGAVNGMDVNLALRQAMGIIQLDQAGFLAADIDGSGEVTTNDALRIMRYYMGISAAL